MQHTILADEYRVKARSLITDKISYYYTFAIGPKSAQRSIENNHDDIYAISATKFIRKK